MTAYIANHQKKKKIFQKREAELRHAMNHHFSEEKIAKAAEKLREAKLNVFKSEFSKQSVLPANRYVPDKDAKYWETLSIENIISQYQK